MVARWTTRARSSVSILLKRTGNALDKSIVAFAFAYTFGLSVNMSTGRGFNGSVVREILQTIAQMCVAWDMCGT